MKILLLGSGGREHALAWKIAQSPKVEQNKTNLDYLKQVISVMQMLNCTLLREMPEQLP